MSKLKEKIVAVFKPGAVRFTVSTITATFALFYYGGWPPYNTATIINWDREWDNKGVWVYVDTLPDDLFNGNWRCIHNPVIDSLPCKDSIDIIIWASSFSPHRDTLSFTQISTFNIDIEVRKENEEVPIVFWVEEDIIDSLKPIIAKRVDSTNKILHLENSGIKLLFEESRIFSFNSSAHIQIRLGSPQTISRLEKEDIIISQALNVYIYNDKIDRHGYSKPSSNVILLPKTFTPGLLLHEIGHCFGLEHPFVTGALADRLLEGAEETNIMVASSNTRRDFTEGQILAMYYTRGSWLARNNPSLPGLDNDKRFCPIRTCLWDTTSYNPKTIKQPSLLSSKCGNTWD